MKTQLEGRAAIVTGGSKGYGAGIAAVLRNRGAEVWITGRDEKVLQETSRRLDVRSVRADVTNSDDWDRLFEEVLHDTGGTLDILVNNAGAGIRIAPLDEQTDEDIERSISVNLTGAIKGARRAAEVMKKQRSGTIVNITSVCDREAWPRYSVYSAAKAGLMQFSKCLYTELREYGVRVTCLSPSQGATSFREAAGLPVWEPEMTEKITKPEELGVLVACICALPPHLAILDLVLVPLVQEIVPL